MSGQPEAEDLSRPSPGSLGLATLSQVWERGFWFQRDEAIRLLGPFPAADPSATAELHLS